MSTGHYPFCFVSYYSATAHIPASETQRYPMPHGTVPRTWKRRQEPAL